MRVIGTIFEATSGISRFLATPGDPIVVGRNPPFAPRNVRVHDRFIGNQHFAVIATEARCTIEDTFSSGGTFVNGKRATGPTPVGPGDRIALSAHLVFTLRAFSGESLWDHLLRAPLGLEPSLRMARQVAVQLASLHSRDDCHGAINPHAILLDDDGTATLLFDGWGVLGDDGALLCNPAYCAPETFSEARLERTSDVYALGLVLYEALAGRPPFSLDHVHDHMLLKLRGDLALEPSWPTPVSNLLAAMLARDEPARPDVSRLLDELDRC